MEREILFRGKRADNGKWIYGDLCRGEGNKDFAISTNSIGLFEVIPETIGQFTGLLDKKGTKIFEGDILQSELDIVYRVIWDNINGRYLGKTDMESIIYVGREPKSTVIGNIHDNPEFL